MKKLSISEHIKRKAFNIYKKTETSLHELRSILWECTLKCNLNCGHCGSDCTASCNVPNADQNLFYSALESIKTRFNPANVMVGITGGEPLMRQDLPQIIQHIKQMGFPVGIVSNGFAMTPQKFIELINAGLNTLTFSLDGLKKEHNQLRKNPLSYQHVYTAIKNAASFIEQSKNKAHFDFDVVTCVSPINIGSLEQIKDSLLQAGVKHWRLFAIFPSGRAVSQQYNLSREQFTYLMEFILQERKKNEIEVSYSCEGWLDKYEAKVRSSYYFCRAGITNAGIFIDGKVGGCISARSKDFIAGDLHQKSFIDIWENDFDIHRNRQWAYKGMCAKCKDFKYCLGNGLHLYDNIASEPNRCFLAQ